MPRYLTPAEIALIRPIFRNALDYAAIHIHGRRYLPLQNACTAMSPNGHSYYPRPLYRADFAHGTWQERHLFIHECSHIWQHRLGYPVRRCGVWLALQGGYIAHRAYRYQHLLAGRHDLAQFNMEQQAQIIADFFTQKLQYQHEDAALKRVLQRFLRNPADAGLLPRRMRL